MVRSGRFALGAFLLGLFIFYASVVVSPVGYAPKDLRFDEAMQIFLHVRYETFGSDQRADWMANLLMLAPFGFLVAMACTGGWGMGRRIFGGCVALAICVAYVLAVKFAQVFFPRTVNLNYIAAQVAGSACGVAVCVLFRDRIMRAGLMLDRRGPESLVVLLAAATLAICAFMLVPFDVVMSAADIAERQAALSGLLWQVPGTGRGHAVQLVVIAAGMLSVMPIGMLLPLLQPRRGLGVILLQSLLAMALLTFLALFVIGAQPALINVPLRAGGMLAGAMLLRFLQRHDIRRYRGAIGRASLVAVPFYLVALVVVNGLATVHWRSLDDAMAAVDHRFYIPLWTDYIVSKAQAARSVLAELAMYAPIGLVFWARGARGRGSAWLAALVAFLLSAGVEMGRWLKPGLALDINNPAIAAIAAALAVTLMPFVWDVLCSLRTGGGRAVSVAPAVIARASGGAASRLLRAAVFVACAAGVGALLMQYPLSPMPLATALVIYAALLLWRPACWLLVIPAVIPALQLAPWTGWMVTGESDLFVLATVGLLAWRTPPVLRDFHLGRATAVILGLFLASTACSVALGLRVPEPVGGTSDAYMSAVNALRLVKPIAVAVLLMPFAARRQRSHGDVLALFAMGMTIGLCAVGGEVVLERLAFVDLLDFSTDYRVVGPFASMHVGGGHIGAYLALAIPFCLVWLLPVRGWRLLAFVTVATLGGYALVVTFARTAYAAAGFGVMTAALALVAAGRLQLWSRVLAGLVLVGVIGGSLAASTLSSSFMMERVRQVLPDSETRLANWRAGMALLADDPVSRLFGMGTGSYLRLTAAAPSDHPSDFVVRMQDGMTGLTLATNEPLYLGQKVTAEIGASYAISFMARAEAGSSIGVALCEKMLLYSVNCGGHGFVLVPGAGWTLQQASLSMPHETAESGRAWLHRPVELGFFAPAGSRVSFTDVHLIDASGRNLVANGEFLDGTEHWYFTADNHVGWRILDQYLMTLLEDGALGLVTLGLVFATALAHAVRALRQGNLLAAATIGSIAAIGVSFISDAVLESLSVATLVYLVIGLAIIGSKQGVGSAHTR